MLKIHQELEPPPSDYVFVFGSNLAGKHGAGAARYARIFHSAIYGTPIGYMSNNKNHSYAIPTKTANLSTMPISEIIPHIETFIEFAHSHQEFNFYLTRIGCGLAGYQDHQIAPLFSALRLNNISIPDKWAKYLLSETEQNTQT